MGHESMLGISESTISFKMFDDCLADEWLQQFAYDRGEADRSVIWWGGTAAFFEYGRHVCYSPILRYLAGAEWFIEDYADWLSDNVLQFS